MAGMGIDRSVSHARFSLRRYTVPQLVFGGIGDYGVGYSADLGVHPDVDHNVSYAANYGVHAVMASMVPLHLPLTYWMTFARCRTFRVELLMRYGTSNAALQKGGKDSSEDCAIRTRACFPGSACGE
jgi:hypothetical protein